MIARSMRFARRVCSVRPLAGGVALAFGIGAAGALAEARTICVLSTDTVSTVGGALTGGSTNQIWITQQCVDDDGAVRTTATLCEIDDDIDPRDAPTCSAPAELGAAVSRPEN